MDVDIIHLIQEAATRKLLFLPHALNQMNHPDRLITPSEVRQVISNGEIIEDYPNDQRGHSCLMLGKGKSGRPIHVVCSPKEDFLVIITAYLPDRTRWTSDFKRRIRK